MEKKSNMILACQRYCLSQDIYAVHLDDFLNKNTHIFERNAIKIDKRENIQDIFIDTLSFFTRKNSKKR